MDKKLFSELMNSSYGQYLTYIEQTYMPELEMNKKDLKPSVDLTYSLSDSDKFSSSIDHRRSSSLSLTLSVPLYDGYKDENNFDIKRYEYQKKLLHGFGQLNYKFHLDLSFQEPCLIQMHQSNPHGERKTGHYTFYH